MRNYERHTADCRAMSDLERQEHRRAQKRAYYNRLRADPDRLASRNAYARERDQKLHGPRKRADLSGLATDEKRAHKRALQRAYRQRRMADPAYRVKLRAQSRDRVDYKRRWQQVHAADLNSRRRIARAANPRKYREQEKAAKRRRQLGKQTANAK
jgi:hypothetical protein